MQLIIITLLWKEFQYFKNKWFFIIIPLILFIILLIINDLFNIEPPSNNNDQNENGISLEPPTGMSGVYYTPNDNITLNFIDGFREQFLMSDDKFIPCKSPEVVSDSITETETQMGIVFNQVNYPKILNYTINTLEYDPITEYNYVTTLGKNRDYGERHYAFNGLLESMKYIDSLFVKNVSSPYANVEINFNKMPHAKQIPKDISNLSVIGTWFLIFLSIMLFFSSLVPLLNEKCSGFNEKIGAHVLIIIAKGVANLIYGLLHVLLLFIAIVAFNSNMRILQNISIVIFYHITFLFAFISFIIMLSSFFHNVISAGIWFLLYTTISITLKLWLNPYTWFLVYLLPNYLYLEGLETFKTMQLTGRSFTLQLSDSFETANDRVNISMAMIVFFVQSIVYILLYIYVINIYPGKYGIGKDWTWIFCGKNCIGKCWTWIVKNFQKKQSGNDQNSSEPLEEQSGEHGFIMRNVFIQNHITRELKIKKNDITVLLGHDGAGKTALLKMIYELISTNSSKVQIPGGPYDSSVVSYYLNDDFILPYMSCSEQLKFFAKIQIQDDKEAEEISDMLINELGINNTKKLGSFTMDEKRLLGIGIALASKARIIILDEPVLGLNMEIRDKIWNYLLRHCNDRTILIASTSLDEVNFFSGQVIRIKNCKILEGYPTTIWNHKKGTGYILEFTENKSKTLNIKTIIDFIKHDSEMEQKMKQKMEQVIIEEIPFVPPHFKIQVKPKNKYLKSTEYWKIVLIIMQKIAKRFKPRHLKISTLFNGDVNSNNHNENNRDQLKAVFSSERYNNEIDQFFKQFKAIVYKRYILMKYFIWTHVAMSILLLSGFLWISNYMNIAQSTKISYTPQKFNADSIPNAQILIFFDENSTELMNKINDTVIRDIELIKKNKATLSLRPIKNISLINDTLLKLEQDDFVAYHELYPFVIHISQSNVNSTMIDCFVSPNYLHSSPTCVNFALNLYLKLMNTKHQIFSEFAPVSEVSYEMRKHQIENYKIVMPILVFISMLVFAIIPSFEKQIKFKYIKPIYGWIYWPSMYIFDMVICLLNIFIIWLAHYIKSPIHILQELTFWMPPLICYSTAILSLFYSLCATVKSSSSVFGYLLFLVAIESILNFLFSTKVDTQPIITIIQILNILPTFGLRYYLNIMLSRESQIIDALNKTNTEYSDHLKRYTNLDENVFFYVTIAVVMIEMSFLIYFRENKRNLRSMWINTKSRFANQRRNTNNIEELPFNELLNSHQKSNSNGETNKHITLDVNVKKGKVGSTTIKDISFKVEEGHIHALLGSNGSGKTTLLKMILTELPIDSGEMRINGISYKHSSITYLSSVGYCPQVNALNNYLTVKEHLKYFAIIHNVNTQDTILEFLGIFDLERDANKPVAELSSGVKRKLSIAIAMIGKPKLLILDQPTMGIDQLSHPKIWQLIKEYKKYGTVVLATHDMIECEKLCDKLSLLSDGSVILDGTFEDLKTKFPFQSKVVIILKENLTEDRRKDIENEFKTIAHDGLIVEAVRYKILIKWTRDNYTLLKNVFSVIDKNDWIDYIDDIDIQNPSLLFTTTEILNFKETHRNNGTG